MKTLHNPTYRSRVSNGKVALHGVDGRNAIARRFRDVVDVLVAELGGDPSPAEMLQIRTAAALQVHVEDMTSRNARGETVTAEDLTRAANGALRAVASLKRSRVPSKATKGRAVRAYLDGKGGGQ